MVERTMDKSISRLAQYRPFAQEGRVVQAALSELVMAAAAEAGGGFASLGEAREAIQTLFRLEIEIDELRHVVTQLVDQAVAVARLGGGGGFDLSDVQHEDLESRAAASAQIEEKAFADWQTAIRTLDPSLSDARFAELREDLDEFLKRVISRHGVEAALILYPEIPRARSLYAEVEAVGLDLLPERSGQLRRVREQAIQIFVQQPTPEQRTYLSNLLNVSYFLTVLSLDPTAGPVVRAQVKGHRLYLDTNVLYAALALSKMSEVVSVRRVLELTKQLGIELAITSWTLAELKQSLRRAEQAVKARALPPREWAQIMADATSQQGFITAYWRQYKDRGVTPEDFFAFYSALESILKEDGIIVIDDGCDRVDGDPEVIELEIPRLDSVLRRGADRRGADPRADAVRPDVVMRHDIKHRLLVERLRGNGVETFAAARYWFLTQDSALPRYAAIVDPGRSSVPFCASTSAWAQVVRSLVPRTEDLDQALVDLLASPYMRYRGGVSPQDIQEVVARIDQYDGVSAELASEVLLNGALVRDISKTVDPQERIQRIDSAVVKSAETLHVRVETMSARDAEQREALRRAEAENASSASQAAAALARVRELQAQLEEARQTSAATEQAASARERTSRTELEDRMAAAEQQLAAVSDAQAGRSAARRRALAFGLVVIGVAAPAVLIVLGAVAGVWPIVGVLLGGLLLVCLGVWLVLGLTRTWQAFLGGGATIGIVAAVQQIVSALTS